MGTVKKKQWRENDAGTGDILVDRCSKHACMHEGHMAGYHWSPLEETKASDLVC